MTGKEVCSQLRFIYDGLLAGRYGPRRQRDIENWGLLRDDLEPLFNEVYEQTRSDELPEIDPDEYEAD